MDTEWQAWGRDRCCYVVVGWPCLHVVVMLYLAGRVYMLLLCCSWLAGYGPRAASLGDVIVVVML